MFCLASERGLDTMLSCGSRSRMSQGQLIEEKRYQAANNTAQCIYRPCIGGVYKEITQRDLDILRAVITKYLAEREYTPFAADDPERVLALGFPDVISDRDELFSRVMDGMAVEIPITSEEIRKMLGKTKDSLDAASITSSFQKLEALRVEGVYKVRTPAKTIDISINGNLLNVEVGKGHNRNNYYQVIFGTKWGQLLLHNLKAGNLTWISNEKYHHLRNEEKNILYTLLSFPEPVFRRKIDDALSIFGIRVGQNKKRAIFKLYKHLNQLKEEGVLDWECTDTAVHITRKIKASEWLPSAEDVLSDIRNEKAKVKSRKNKIAYDMDVPIPADEHEQSVVSVVHDKEYFRNLARQLEQKPQRSIQEQAFMGIIGTIEALDDKMDSLENKEAADDIKRTILRKKWEELSPYYLWSVDWFHTYLKSQFASSSVKHMLDYFDEINRDESLQMEIRNFVSDIEKAFDLYFEPDNDMDI